MPRLSSFLVDPVFAEIAKALYGDDVDPRELQDFAKSGVDASTVHVDGPVAAKKKMSDEKRLAVTGLAATGVAGVAGLHAIKATRIENAERITAAGGKAVGRHRLVKPTAVSRIARVTRMKPTRVASVIGAGMLGLHGVELVGDSLGARAQVRAIKDANETNPVVKAFRTKPLNAIPTGVPSLRAKRVKLNPLPANPKTQAGVFQPVNKGARAMARSIGATVRNVQTTTANAAHASGEADRAAKEAADSVARVKHLIPRARTAALVGGGTAASMVGASYAGSYHAGRHRDRKKLVAKSAPDEVVWTGEIAKVDVDKRQVFGWASVSRINGEDIVDLQGDIVEIDEIEKSAYQYVLESRKGGDMHRRVSKYAADQPLHTADMIESFVVTPEKLEKMGLPEDALPLGWWVGYHVNDDEQWQKVKDGERTGFSIHGKGTRKSVSKAAGRHRSEPAARAKPDLTYMPMRTADRGVKQANRLRAHLIRRGPLITQLSGFTADVFKADDERHRPRPKPSLHLRERTGQALHPPAVLRHEVASTAIRSMGYQPQTRRLDYEMLSRPGRPYTAHVKGQQAVEAMLAPSKGHYFATQIRGKTKRPEHYSPADRARLFLDPQRADADG